MGRFISRIVRIIISLLLYSQQTNTQQIPFDTIVSFGDSNTDTGNVYNLTNHTWPLVPPYFRGRFSNGPVWVENFAVSNFINYAHGGATTDNNFIQGYTASDTQPVPGVRQQILIYLNSTKTMDFARTLYIIWGGSNDYYFNATLNPSAVVASLSNAVKDLLNISVKHILIINQSPIEAMPFIRTPDQAAYYRARTLHHNANLSASIAALQGDFKQVSLKLFDIYSLISNIIANDSIYALNKVDSCWNITNGQVIVVCSNPESYVYIDQYHYSTRIHKFIADAVRQFVSVPSGTIRSSYSIRVFLSGLFFLRSLSSF